MATINNLYIALTLGYINKEEFDKIEEKMVGLAKQIGGFIKYLEEKRRNNEFTTR